jgi:hypothetical protein
LTGYIPTLFVTLGVGNDLNKACGYRLVTGSALKGVLKMKKGLAIMTAMLLLAVFAYAQITPPFTANFDGTEVPYMPSGWVKINVEGDSRSWITEASHGHSAPNCLYMNTNSPTGSDDWAISPSLHLSAGTSYNLEFYYRSDGPIWTELLGVYLGSAPTVAAMQTHLTDVSITSWTYAAISVTVTVPSTGNYFLGFYAHSAANMNFIAVDDVSLVAATPLAEPVLTITKVSRGVQLDWGNVPGANSYNIYASNDIPTSPDAWGLPIASTNSFTYLYTGAERYKFFMVRASN